jgi:hypothetical protein
MPRFARAGPPDPVAFRPIPRRCPTAAPRPDSEAARMSPSPRLPTAGSATHARARRRLQRAACRGSPPAGPRRRRSRRSRRSGRPKPLSPRRGGPGHGRPHRRSAASCERFPDPGDRLGEGTNRRRGDRRPPRAFLGPAFGGGGHLRQRHPPTRPSTPLPPGPFRGVSRPARPRRGIRRPASLDSRRHAAVGLDQAWLREFGLDEDLDEDGIARLVDPPDGGPVSKSPASKGAASESNDIEDRSRLLADASTSAAADGANDESDGRGASDVPGAATPEGEEGPDRPRPRRRALEDAGSLEEIDPRELERFDMGEWIDPPPPPNTPDASA